MQPDATRDRWTSVLHVLDRAGDLDAPPAPGDPALQERFLDLAWPILEPTGISWMGFYLSEPDDPAHDHLVLGPSRGGPACSPIGLHGACGRAFRSGAPLVVHDVADLGAEYIACDPRDRSELVVPINGRGRVLGVLDLDSHLVGAFDDGDALELTRMVLRAGLSDPPSPPVGAADLPPTI